jgi:integrase/recombinase XerD
MTPGMDLDARLAAYLELRRALGTKMDADARVLRDFVRFVGDRGAITSRTVLDWIEARKQPGTRTAAQRLSSVRQFLLYLSAALPETQVPEPRVVAGYRRPTPFLFTPEEIEALLKCAAEFEPGRFSSVVVHTALGLLAATGLRPSEALGLDRSDVMPRNGPEPLLIREGKFHKSRIVPLHPTAAEQLRVYAGHRELLGYSLQTSAFFVSSYGGRLAYDTLRQRFITLLDRAGIGPRENCNKPTLHSLRHTFVVSRLRRWHEEGVDVERRLAHLATYLGHMDVRETYWYMTVTPELLTAATTDFRAPRLAGGEQ